MAATTAHPLCLPALFPAPPLRPPSHPTSPSRSHYASDDSLDIQSPHRSARSIFDRGPEFFLPSTILSELSEPVHTPSLSALEDRLAAGDSEGARARICDLVSRQPDEFEQGRLLRASADLAKRAGHLSLAASLFAMATSRDPSTLGSWVDRAKLHEEQGDYDVAEQVLEEGVHRSRGADQLLRKLLRSLERSGDSARARRILGHLPADGDGSLLTEGALFELRQGDGRRALALLAAIKARFGWRPATYAEVIQHYDRMGALEAAAPIVAEAAASNPRNAVVCEALFKIQPDADATIRVLQRERPKWTSEFQDRMIAAICDALARRGELETARRVITQGIFRAPPPQRSKLLITAAIAELIHGDLSLPPLLLNAAKAITPPKARAALLLLVAKVCELNGEIDEALQLFQKAVRDFRAEWRVWFELAQFLLHRADVQAAQAVLAAAMQLHAGNGRLWAFRVQIQAWEGVEAQVRILREAINAVPKSGEVWCEAARICLNPLGEYFNIDAARQHLELAYRFTPQHGDTLVELVRLEILAKGRTANFGELRRKFLTSEGNYGLLHIFLRRFDDRSSAEMFPEIVKEVAADIDRNRRVYARAIARSAFVPRSVADEKVKLADARAGGRGTDFAFGLTALGRCILNPDACQTGSQKLSIVLGMSATVQ